MCLHYWGTLDKTLYPTRCCTSAVHLRLVSPPLRFNAEPLCPPAGHGEFIFLCHSWSEMTRWRKGREPSMPQVIVSDQCTCVPAAPGFTLFTRRTLATVFEGFCLGLFCCSGAREQRSSWHVHSWCSFWLHVLLIGVLIIPATLCVCGQCCSIAALQW